MGESGNNKWRRKNQKTKAEWKAEMERAVGHRSRNQGKRTKDIVMNDIEKRIDEKAAAAKAAAARAGSASEASDGSEAAESDANTSNDDDESPPPRRSKVTLCIPLAVKLMRLN